MVVLVAVNMTDLGMKRKLGEGYNAIVGVVAFTAGVHNTDRGGEQPTVKWV